MKRAVKTGTAISPTVLRTYSFVTAIVLLLFGLWRSTTNGPYIFLAYAQMIAGLVLIINVSVGNLAGRTAYVKNVFMSIVLFFMLIMLITGGMRGAGLLWLFAFPVMAFFLTGRREGLWWVSTMFGSLVAITLAAASNLLVIAYEPTTLAQLAASLLIITVSMYIYQQSRERLMTRAKSGEAALQVEKTRSDVIVQSLSEGVVVTDTRGIVTFINQAAESMLGWGKDELIGTSFNDKVALRDTPGPDKPNEAAVTLTVRTTYSRKDGKHLPIALARTPLIVNGKAVGTIRTFHDTIEEENILRAKSEFVTLASHQLRTPVTAISWVSELLLDGEAGKLNPGQHAHVTEIAQSNQRMAALIGEMLIVSSLDLQDLPVLPEKTNVRRLAGEIVKEQSDLYKHKHHTITQEYDPSLPDIDCDPQVIKLIVRNLLSNAFKYTPANQGITVRLQIDKTEKLRPDSAGSMVLTVADNGYGIPKNANDKIFRKFFRADNITHHSTDGTGLGLYVVKTLLNYVGGRVTFSSTEDKGTTFRVALPLEGMERREPHDRKTALEALQIEREELHV